MTHGPTETRASRRLLLALVSLVVLASFVTSRSRNPGTPFRWDQ